MSNWNVPEKPSDPSSPSSGGQSPYGAPYPQGGEQQGQSPYGQSPYGQPYPSHGDPIGQHGYWQNPQGGPPGKRPGLTTAALVLTWVGSGLALPGLLLLFFAAGSDEFAEAFAEGAGGADADFVTGFLRITGGIGIVLSVVAILLAFLVLRRSNVARILLAVVGSLAAFVGLAFFPLGLIWTIMCVVGVVFLFVTPTNQWMRR